MRTPRSVMALFALAAGGCGTSGLADGRYHGETIATFKGRLAAADASGAIAMAILWAPSFDSGSTSAHSGSMQPSAPSGMSGGGMPTPGGMVPPPNNGGGHGTGACPLTTPPEPFREHLMFPHWVTESVSYQARFPIDFEVPISSVPSPSVQVDLAPYGGQGRASIGVLIAYEDTDGNGTFTPSAPGSMGDRLIASSSRPDGVTLIVFLDGTLPANSDAAIVKVIPPGAPQGFSIVDFTGPSQVALHTVQGTTIELVQADPGTGNYEVVACSSVDINDVTTPDGAPVPQGADVSCSSDRHSYRWTLRANAVCTEGATFGSGCWDPAAPQPSGWPCP